MAWIIVLVLVQYEYMIKNIEASPGITKLETGHIIQATPITRRRVLMNPGSTPIHEAIHAVAGIVDGAGVEYTTIVPTRDSYGSTKLLRPSVGAAAAPHFRGCKGTGHDMGIVEAMGYDEGSAMLAAASLIAGHDDEIGDVAAELVYRGTLSGSEIEGIMKERANPRFRIDLIEPDGIETHYIRTVRKGQNPILSLNIPDKTKDPKARATLIFG